MVTDLDILGGTTSTIIPLRDEQRYLFDLQGYVILRQVVPQVLLASANSAMERLEALTDEQLPSASGAGVPAYAVEPVHLEHP